MNGNNFLNRNRQSLLRRYEADRTIERMPSPVYYVECSNDDTVLVGMQVGAQNSNDGWYVSWFDTAHQRAMKANMVVHDEENDTLVFRRSDEFHNGDVYKFSPMTLEIYNDKVKQRLWNPKEFTSVDDMNEAFLKTIQDDV